MSKTRVIGIDVGTNAIAVSVFVKDKIIFWDIFENQKSISNGEKLSKIEAYLRKVFEKERPDVIVYEGTFWNPREARGYSYVSMAIGIIEKVAWEVLRIKPVKLSPSTVKKLVCGNGRAKKEEVAEVVKNLFDLPPALPDHITDSIAVGYAFLLQKSEVI